MIHFWVSGCGGFTSLKVDKHLKGSPRRFAKAQVHQGDQAKVSTLLYQVLLLGISAAECDIVKIFPERKIYIKSSSIVCLCLSGLIEGRQLLGIQPPITSLFLLVKSVGGRNIGYRGREK